jgi:uncharacterized protein YggU (UPF0235/DUF167 family)
VQGGVLRVDVTAAPEDGKANAAVVETLSRALGLSKSLIVIVRGQTSWNKTVRFSRVSVEAVRAKLATPL